MNRVIKVQQATPKLSATNSQRVKVAEEIDRLRAAMVDYASTEQGAAELSAIVERHARGEHMAVPPTDPKTWSNADALNRSLNTVAWGGAPDGLKAIPNHGLEAKVILREGELLRERHAAVQGLASHKHRTQNVARRAKALAMTFGPTAAVAASSAVVLTQSPSPVFHAAMGALLGVTAALDSIHATNRHQDHNRRREQDAQAGARARRVQAQDDVWAERKAQQAGNVHV